MFATFDGTLSNNRLEIPELGEAISTLFGKSVAILTSELQSGAKLLGQPIFQGIIKPETIQKIDYDGEVTVIIRQPVEMATENTIFDEKFVLGSKIGDVDN